MNTIDGLYKSLELINIAIEEAPPWANQTEVIDLIIKKIQEEIKIEIDEYEKHMRSL